MDPTLSKPVNATTTKRLFDIERGIGLAACIIAALALGWVLCTYCLIVPTVPYFDMGGDNDVRDAMQARIHPPVIAALILSAVIALYGIVGLITCLRTRNWNGGLHYALAMAMACATIGFTGMIYLEAFFSD